MITYSFVVPIYNDGRLAEAFCHEFQRVFQQYLGRERIAEFVELIFVNDGSRNDSYALLKPLPSQFAFVKVMDLSRNFGQHIALSAGYQHAKGSYVGMLNVDMQDPPHEIPNMLKAMEENDADIAVGIREARRSSLAHRFTSYAFNWVLNKMTGFDAPLNVATLRIMNRRFTDAYNSLNEKARYLPGLELWLGFKHLYVPISHQDRSDGGKSSYTFRKRLRMAVESILAFSDRPLKMTAILGFIVSTLGVGMGFLLLLQKLFLEDFQPGYTSTVSLILFLGGVQIFVTGLCGLYIGRTLNEAQNRPLYLVRETINF